jgi:hypothetical protein
MPLWCRDCEAREPAVVSVKWGALADLALEPPRATGGLQYEAGYPMRPKRKRLQPPRSLPRAPEIEAMSRSVTSLHPTADRSHGAAAVAADHPRSKRDAIEFYCPPVRHHLPLVNLGERLHEQGSSGRRGVTPRRQNRFRRATARSRGTGAGVTSLPVKRRHRHGVDLKGVWPAAP